MSHFPPFTTRMMPLLIDDVDTDQIIPARFLKGTDKEGLGDGLFADWRYDSNGTPNPRFVLNQPAYRGAGILVGGRNFGCGSSREHAPWALKSAGFRAVISTSFADIFRNNALKNSLLPIVVDDELFQTISGIAVQRPETQVTVDLERQTIFVPSIGAVKFPLDDFSRKTLLDGIDELGYIMSFESKIAEYEAMVERSRR